MLEKRTYFMPAMSMIGPGVLQDVGAEIKSLGCSKVLLVTDAVLNKIGTVKKVTDVLEATGIDYVLFDGVQPNPTCANVDDGLKMLMANECDIIVSLGGGSPQDCAKAVSILATNGGDIRDYEGVFKSSKKGLPIVAINTTAGTASDVTINYVITDEERHVKMVMVDKNSLATIAVNDPELMIAKPAALTAATGMDALTHAIEAYITKGAYRLTDALAFESIKLISESLRDAVAKGDDLEARSKMAYGSFVAGMSFSNCGLGVVHSLAHQLGGVYNLPHGVCNAVLLPHVMRFNAPVCAEKMAKVADAMGVDTAGMTAEQAADAAIAAVEKLSADVGIPAGLAELGVQEDKLEEMAKLALVDPCAPGNPRDMSLEDAVSIYKAAL
ncbi:iron-containing alcohol dehydrogenase [Tichowtungia aerotolerans]|uniref:Iron-containing alcohol dehydrogenase n=1 Tax=Tichowtungia aerotolerans TaxID=2697043 RepID=A0A6P1MC70_9BACT|nr:iron-containing alcohol dehydrogenase [Tichowtungia aerotolerans]QHI70703.1 iron-containing alcohol dehydrogenase [Tichowtungia aerotolerans]